jgi:hypothetical protein
MPGASGKDRIEMVHDVRLAADHQAVAILQAPDTAAGPYVHVVYAALLQLPGAANIQTIVRVTAVDDDVAAIEQQHQGRQLLLDNGRRQHEPHDPRRGEPLDQVSTR